MSQRVILLSHCGQRDDPQIDFPMGIRPAATLRKLPKLAPTAKNQKVIKNSEERRRTLSATVMFSDTGPWTKGRLASMIIAAIGQRTVYETTVKRRTQPSVKARRRLRVFIALTGTLGSAVECAFGLTMGPPSEGRRMVPFIGLCSPCRADPTCPAWAS